MRSSRYWIREIRQLTVMTFAWQWLQWKRLRKEVQCIEQSLILFLKSFKLDGPNYISKFVYTLNIKLNTIYEAAGGLNVVQPRYNSEPYHVQLLFANDCPHVEPVTAYIVNNQILDHFGTIYFVLIWLTLGSIHRVPVHELHIILPVYIFLHTLGISLYFQYYYFW